MSNPWMKFYTSDWRSDPALRMCSMAARGVWVELICLMHESTPYGHLLVNGQSPTDAQLSVLVGATPDQITASLGELEAAGVFSRTRAGVIYSRKLTRMSKKAATARNNGRKGGNPNLSKEKENLSSVKGMDKVCDKPQKPEARSQIEKEEDKSSSQKKASRRKSRIPERAVITENMVRYAFDRGLSQQEAEAQFSKFKNNALAKGLTYLDWDRAFITWLDSPYFKPITGGFNAPGHTQRNQGPSRQGGDRRLDRIARLAGVSQAQGSFDG